ncbi:MAG: hypothetical protein GY847_10090 [Proteobacteria bacterium]|nr:hypothetical protein [Pseudomonadota bacterium]
MTQKRLIRDYENSELPIERRLPSLARRFSCLKDADGLEPWSPEELHHWVVNKGDGTPAWHAGHLILNLSGNGSWNRFDAIAAVQAWSEEDRNVFATWARSWTR